MTSAYPLPFSSWPRLLNGQVGHCQHLAPRPPPPTSASSVASGSTCWRRCQLMESSSTVPVSAASIVTASSISATSTSARGRMESLGSSSALPTIGSCSSLTQQPSTMRDHGQRIGRRGKLQPQGLLRSLVLLLRRWRKRRRRHHRRGRSREH